MKPDWPEVLGVLAGNLKKFPTLTDHDHQQLLITADLLLMAANEFDVALGWRQAELDDFRLLLEDPGGGPAAAAESAHLKVGDVAAQLAEARAQVIDLHIGLAAETEGADSTGAALRAAVRRSIDRRAQILEGTDTAWS